MTQISLSKALALIDHNRGQWLKVRGSYEKSDECYRLCSAALRMLNVLKKELSIVSDADQLPLGL